MANTPLIRNSIPQQRLTKNERLKTKAWNDYINVLKEQANANTRYLEGVSKELVEIHSIIDILTGGVPPEGCDTDAFLFLTGTPDETYDNTAGYGKLIGNPFTL